MDRSFEGALGAENSTTGEAGGKIVTTSALRLCRVATSELALLRVICGGCFVLYAWLDLVSLMPGIFFLEPALHIAIPCEALDVKRRKCQRPDFVVCITY